MNNLLVKIEENYLQAVKGQDRLAVSTLRLLKSALGNAKISQGEELSDSEVMALIKKEIKNRNESIVYLERAEKNDQVKLEKDSIELLQKYLPPGLSDSEIESIVEKSIEKFGSKSVSDFGKIMGLVMSELKGKADPTKVSSIIKSKLS